MHFSYISIYWRKKTQKRFLILEFGWVLLLCHKLHALRIYSVCPTPHCRTGSKTQRNANSRRKKFSTHFKCLCSCLSLYFRFRLCDNAENHISNDEERRKLKHCIQLNTIKLQKSTIYYVMHAHNIICSHISMKNCRLRELNSIFSLCIRLDMANFKCAAYFNWRKTMCSNQNKQTMMRYSFCFFPFKSKIIIFYLPVQRREKKKLEVFRCMFICIVLAMILLLLNEQTVDYFILFHFKW